MPKAAAERAASSVAAMRLPYFSPPRCRADMLRRCLFMPATMPRGCVMPLQRERRRCYAAIDAADMLFSRLCYAAPAPDTQPPRFAAPVDTPRICRRHDC